MRYEIFLFLDISYLISRISYLWLGEGIKNPHPPNESGVGYKSIPRFHPGYGQGPSLIDALTGAPVGAFLPRGSEVVSSPAGLRAPCTKTASSLGIFPGPHVFITAFLYKKSITFYTKCQSPSEKVFSGTPFPRLVCLHNFRAAPGPVKSKCKPIMLTKSYKTTLHIGVKHLPTTQFPSPVNIIIKTKTDEKVRFYSRK